MTYKSSFVRACLVAVGVAVTLVAPPAAEATFHLISVREVFAGSSAAPQAEYVELQMYSGGQDLVGGHTLSFYDGAGASSGSASFGGDVANGANQSTVLAATPAAESLFGVAADTSMPADSLDPSGGAVCWESLDCVAWGSFHGTVLSAVGSPADSGGIPDGLALRRSIAPGCSTLLEAADDSDSSAADFFDAAPAPRPNSVAPSEHVCAAPGKEGGETGAGGGGGGAGKGAGGRPQTTIRSGPPHRSRRRTATFRFVSSKPGATFVCKLDGGRFKRCRSPYTLRGLAVGHHVFRVTARLGGVADPSPARWAFRVLPRR